VPHSFEIYIDESGEQGFSFDGPNKSSEWLVVAGVIAPIQHIQDLRSTAHDIKTDVSCPPKKVLHFKKLKSEHYRRCAIAKVAALHAKCRAVVVMVHKPSLSHPEAFTEKNRLYFYACRFLLERASWCCANALEYREKKHGDGTAKVIFSAMSELSRDRIQSYFHTLQAAQTTIDWTVIRPKQFETLAPNRHAGLQIADVVASGFYCAEHHDTKFKVHEWAHSLKPIMYRSARGKYKGYGLKMFPSEVDKKVAQGTFCPWATFFPE
jgi:hypothetical protein